MSRPKVESCDIVPRTRAQRSIAQVWPVDATAYHEPAPAQPVTRYTPSDGIGRFPTIGIDRGAWQGAAPGDHL